MMSAPPTNGYRILIYGQDPTLLETRRLLLATEGFRVNIVASLKQFRGAVEHARPPYELFILCHTVPEDERKAIQDLAAHIRAGLYQLQKMGQPRQFLRDVSGRISLGGGDNSVTTSYHNITNVLSGGAQPIQSQYRGPLSQEQAGLQPRPGTTRNSMNATSQAGIQQRPPNLLNGPLSKRWLSAQGPTASASISRVCAPSQDLGEASPATPRRIDTKVLIPTMSMSSKVALNDQLVFDNEHCVILLCRGPGIHSMIPITA